MEEGVGRGKRVEGLGGGGIKGLGGGGRERDEREGGR